MTTATIPDVDLERLLDDAPACELLESSSGEIGVWLPCGQPADWVIRCHSGECEHLPTAAVLACDPCLRTVLGLESLLWCPGSDCELAVYIDGVIKL